MKQGCEKGMRSVVGFLSRREVKGDPLIKDKFQRKRLEGCSNLYKKDLLGHFGCVNAIEFSTNGGEWLVSGGDDRRVLLWHMEKAINAKAKPVQLKGEHHSNIFCLAFDSSNTRIFSGGNDEQVILHDVESETLDVFPHDDAVYGLSVSPINDNVFASSSDDGRVLIWDIRESLHGEPFCLANYPSAFHSVMFNPVEPRLLATANSKEGVGLWDIRKPRSSLLRYGGNLSLQSAMSVRFNSSGSQLLALRRRLPPVLYDIHSRLPVFQFDNQGYFNSCTMKSCCFAGDHDQYILSGSDDFNLYMWRIPSDPEAGGAGRVVNGAFMVLKGHRSIVNQVRFNPHTYMICSSGVEKIIKVWSPYKQPDCTGDLKGEVEDDSRNLYTHEEYISLVLNSGSGLSHDYANQSVQEDPRMMAFFDSLVRREIEGWSSDSDTDSTMLHFQAGASERSGYSDSESSTSLPQLPQEVEESDEAAQGLRCQRVTEASSAREDVVSRQRRYQLRRHQVKRLLPISNESDSDENNDHQMDADSDVDPIPRPRSPSPEEHNSSISTSSDEEEENLNDRRALTRQRNALRRRPKPHQEERTAPVAETTNVYVGDDVYDYPQIKVEDLSSTDSSSNGSPPRDESFGGRISPCSDIESEERKIYKAYKWLQCSYKPQLGHKGEESTHAENEEKVPGPSRSSSLEPSSKEAVDTWTVLTPESTQDHLHLDEQSNGPSNLMDCSFEETPLSIPAYVADSQQCHGDVSRFSQETSSSSFEHNYEPTKLNGKAVCGGLTSQSEDCCSDITKLPEQTNIDCHQELVGQCASANVNDNFLSLDPSRVSGDCCKIHSSETKIQTDIGNERPSPEASCTNHNNGHIHLPYPGHSVQSFGGQGGTPDTVSQLHCVTDNGHPLQTEVTFHKADSKLPDADCSTNEVTRKDGISGLSQRELSTSGSSRTPAGFKRHRTEIEETDPEHSPSEKKLKT
ncbi:DDB1- and CUL4-associated factor 5 isoform X2 [Latimeria chalumnae]|uniref:DDB1- and CUL4-associated factor 5 isoform X2 n=1 Tax=Latimeria chalumnae TaxID=7897 RepID=UPI0003C107F3|nr:PREDICTED: DDB1- and CUL4-associated factor 5 isoform X2 [Latimeria chalumnae]|eukprot:XP_005988421.1 PREDICTED: DDB1- and CUL4-associated factor 5 isoform X2 [Latimeria chalumnae]